VKDRADKILTEKGLVASRSQAKSMIENGDVSVNGVVLKKAGDIIDTEDRIEVTAPLFVGRGALKLEKALLSFSIDPTDKTFLDIGASTGGFTEVLLNAGAKKVYAIDVGHDQLAAKLLNDNRVINMEGINIRDLHDLPELGDGGVMDLSFISITKVLDNVKTLLKPGSPLIALVKPQFEAGRERLPKDGVIKDIRVQEAVLREVIDYAIAHGWDHHGTIDSPIEGKSGNKEFLCWFTSTLP
jgi:23S rRNA (cytidine1920-2'-O)/16S rRNA (cytidine1409-2'-O)-methyltransferase